MSKENPDRFARFVADIEALCVRTGDERRLLEGAKDLVGRLVSVDDWLPDAYAAPDLSRYQQYLLYRDPQGRFSVVSFVWGPGQQTPVHDHTVWGVIGMLRGAEISEAFAVDDGLRSLGPPHELRPGDVEAVSPTIGDIHQVSNALADQTSISIHLYGADIGAVRRSTFDRSGAQKSFVSGYADAPPLLGSRAQ